METETLTREALPRSTRSLRRYTFEVHAHKGDTVWTLYRRNPATDALTKVSTHGDKRAAVKAGESL